MFFLSTYFQPFDVFLAPLCFLVLFAFIYAKAGTYKDGKISRLLIRAFYFKIFCCLAFTCIMEFYYKGGDTEMYYMATQDMQKGILEGAVSPLKLLTQFRVVNLRDPLATYFMMDREFYPVYEFMFSESNFFVPKFALPFSFLFFKSYLCITFSFGFFALGGAFRLFKTFYHYFPKYYRELGFSILFLPSVAYWSSGLLKDPICFGSIGFLMYAVLNIFILRRNYFWSFFWLVFAGSLLFYIKIYILLALAPGIVLWLFAEFNKLVEDKTLRRVLALITLSISAVLGFFLINYLTSSESAKAFRLDSLAENSNSQRNQYNDMSAFDKGSYFQIQTTNPILMVLYGIVAALFRPFVWEINSLTALLSALEALGFLYFTLLIMFKKGVVTFFRKSFSHHLLQLCLVFTLIFAGVVGSTALNFGSLSRYKIPCLPFYFLMVLIVFRELGLQYPKWFANILGYNKKKQTFR
jgi:hypothetical protein